MKDNIGYKNINEENAKMLADVFKEINEIRRGHALENSFEEQYIYSEREKTVKTKKLRKMIAIDLAIMLFISFSAVSSVSPL